MRVLVALVAVSSVAFAGIAGATPPPAGTFRTAATPTLLAADGRLAAAVVPGNGHSRCTQVVLWRPGSKPVTVTTQVGCGDGGPLEGVDGLALGGNRVLWEETNGGNNLELVVNTIDAGVARRFGELFEIDLGGASEIVAEDWRHRPIVHRLLERLAYRFRFWL